MQQEKLRAIREQNYIFTAEMDEFGNATLTATIHFLQRVNFYLGRSQF